MDTKTPHPNNDDRSPFPAIRRAVDDLIDNRPLDDVVNDLHTATVREAMADARALRRILS